MSDACEICGRELDQHLIQLIDGIAHTYVVDGERRIHCSYQAGRDEFDRGQLRVYGAVSRSLRNHAGRLRNRDAYWDSARLDSYADKLVRDQNLIIRWRKQRARKERA